MMVLCIIEWKSRNETVHQTLHYINKQSLVAIQPTTFILYKSTTYVKYVDVVSRFTSNVVYGKMVTGRVRKTVTRRCAHSSYLITSHCCQKDVCFMTVYQHQNSKMTTRKYELIINNGILGFTRAIKHTQLRRIPDQYL